MAWWLNIAWAVDVAALGVPIEAPRWQVDGAALVADDVRVVVQAIEVDCRPALASPGWLPSVWRSVAPGEVCRLTPFGAVALTISGPETIAGARASDLQQLTRAIDAVVDRSPRRIVTVPVSYGASLWEATPSPIFLVNIPVTDGIVRWVPAGATLLRVAPEGFGPMEIELGAIDKPCADLTAGRAAVDVPGRLPVGWRPGGVRGPSGTTIVCGDSGTIARVVRVSGADSPARWATVAPVLDAYARGEATPQDQPDMSGDVSGLFLGVGVPGDPAAFAGAKGWGTIGTAATVIPFDKDWLAVTTRVELGFAAPFAVVYGLRLTGGPGHQWGAVGVALTGGIGIDGIGIRTLPIALQIPAVLSVAVDVGSAALLLHGDLVWDVATPASRRRGSESLGFVDELAVGAALVVGRGGRVGKTDAALGVYVEGLYQEMMGTRTLGLRVGVGTHSTK